MLEKPLLVHRSSPKVLLKIFTRDYPGNLYIPRNSRRKYTQPVNETPIWIIWYDCINVSTNTYSINGQLVTWNLVLDLSLRKKHNKKWPPKEIHRFIHRHPCRTLAKGCIATPSTAQRTRLICQKRPNPPLQAGSLFPSFSNRCWFPKKSWLEYSSNKKCLGNFGVDTQSLVDWTFNTQKADSNIY